LTPLAIGTRPRTGYARILTIVMAACVLAGCSAAPALPGFPARGKPTAAAAPRAINRFYQQTLGWKDCGSGFQCATLRVPLDYGHPSGQTIGIAVIRRPAGDPGHRLGSLLINPGGPGASGLDFARSASEVLDPSLLAQYDVVGFDPRGVGQSAPITCLDDAQMDAFVAEDPDPQTPAEQDQVIAEAELFARQCKAHSPGLLSHISTRDAARDLDVLRQALGDRRLAYLGFSYGTFLGATYADLFPARVGRLVLDGALDPRLTAAELGRDQAAGFETALRSFMSDCAKLSTCPLGADPAAAEQRLADLLSSIRAHPLPGTTNRPLDVGLAETGIILTLYSNSTWSLLRRALRLALAGDGRGLLQLADSYNGRDPSGHYSSNEAAANTAINCLDYPGARSVTDVTAQLPSYRQASPIFGAAVAWSGLPCAYWPVAPVGKPHTIRAAGARPILVIGTTRDPATPYRWAQGLAAQLSSGVLLTHEGDGHTAYGRGSTCVDQAVDAYLLKGVPPARGLRCA
jgi:pimeloyl-ACP methyl ester carboxylesterase